MVEGRRPCNEDRAVERTIKNGSDKVRIFAVLDGHGGEVSFKKIINFFGLGKNVNNSIFTFLYFVYLNDVPRW